MSKPGHRELKPVHGNQGKTVCMGGKNWISSTIKVFKDKKGKDKKEVTLSKTRFIPETVVKSLGLSDDLFVSGPEKTKKPAA